MERFWIESTLRLKETFLNMFFCLINNYLICYKEDENENFIANEIFDFEKYLLFFDEEKRPFMTELCKTQGFHNFIEKSYKAKKENNEVLFFVEGVKLCAEKGNSELATQAKRIINQILYKNNNVFIIITLASIIFTK